MVGKVFAILCGWQAPGHNAGRQRAVRHGRSLSLFVFEEKLTQEIFFIKR
jgi:hypothetical protein